jgi:predicted aspartyl protease
MKKYIRLIYSLSFLVAAVFISCSYQPPQFSLEQEVVRIPFTINDGTYYSEVIVNEDTIQMMIDTGASISFLSPQFTQNILRRKRTRDARGIVRWLPLGRVNRIEWGGLEIENLLVANDNINIIGINIIGSDILRHFIVKFDHANKEIVLTQNSSLIEKRGIKVPIEIPFGIPKLNLSLNGYTGEFLIDTGHNGELFVKSSFFHSSGLSDLENVEWIGVEFTSAFATASETGENATHITLADCELPGKIFKNAIVFHNASIVTTNRLGTVFMLRFKSVTIDYINGYVYFELPEDVSPFYFSDNIVEAVPVAYLDFLFERVNSFGISINIGNPHTVHILRNNSVFIEKGIEIGDTLAGINQMIFNEVAFNKLESDRDSFRLETNRNRQRNEILNTFDRRDRAIFHFLKNGELISIEDIRYTFLNPPPQHGYGFKGRGDGSGDGTFFNPIPVGYFSKWFSLDRNNYISLHRPWSTLTGEEATHIFVLRDGSRFRFTNNPDTYGPVLE